MSLARRAAGRVRLPDPRAWDRVTWGVLAVVAVALVTRVVGLDVRAVHHDESLHLTYSWYFAEGRGYEHNPLMHGPLQFHLIAAFFRLFGDGEFVARLPHALAGTALVATPLLFRRHLNGTAVVLAAVFLAVSPSILYYSRFARNEPLVGLFTVLMLAAVLYYRRDGRLRWLVMFSAALALNFAAKETAYIFAAVFLLYFNFATAHELFWRPRRAPGATPATPSTAEQVRHGLWLVPLAWVIAALWPLLGGVRRRFGWAARPREADLLVLTMTLVLPLLAAAVEIPLLAAGVEIDAGAERTLAFAAVGATLAISLAVGVLWGRLAWAVCFVVFLGIQLPLYAAWGTHIDGVAGIFWNSLDYWIDQQDVRRGTQPGLYYLMMLPLYESLVLIPGVIGGMWLTFGRRDGFAALLLWWFLAVFVALSAAGEKMPWLTFHLALPLCFLAAYALGGHAPRVAAAVRAGRGSTLAWAGTAAGAAGLGLLFALALWTDYGLNVDHPDTPVEPLIYVQTSPEVPVLAERIVAAVRDGPASRVVVDTQQSLTWPWAWYLRHVPITYVDGGNLGADSVNPDDVLIATVGAVPFGSPIRDGRGAPVDYRHRWWFPEEGYRAATPDAVIEGIADGSMPQRWLRFLVDRV
ncbi:MAG: flippase activity-associated protein Agl23, partial [Dehalococcoidia bacterium]